MRHTRFLAIFFSLLLAVLSVATPVSAAKKKSAKAKTSQTSSKKKSSGSKSSSSKKKGKNNKKGSGKKKKSSNQKSSSAKRTKHYNRAKSNSKRWTTHTEKPSEVASNDSLTLLINNAVLKWVPSNLNPGGLRVNSVKPNMSAHSVQINLNDNFTYLPVTKDFISDLQGVVRHALPDSLHNFSPSLNVGGKSLAYYINRIDKLPAEARRNIPFVRAANPDVIPSKGMLDDKLALWHSHGRYFKGGGWQWQRPLLFETVEDIYTMGYMLPLIVPMLENAGAYVFLPRERDTNVNEVIVDNDLNEGGQIFSQPFYKEITGTQKWENGEYDGFIYDLPDFRDTENPFELGTYRQTRTIKTGNPSIAAWYADIPADGQYAVYVSYKTLPNSASDARYTVNYSGGSKEFLVNQKMGGSTWIYLGTFPLEKGYDDTMPVVTLSNVTSGQPGTVITADAVKIGGGMGNIARSSNRRDVYYDPSTPDNSSSDGDDSDSDEDDGEDDEEDEDADDSTLPDDRNSETTLDPEQTSPQDNDSGKQIAPSKNSYAPTFRTSGYPRFVEGARYWLHWAGFPEDVYSPYHGTNDYKDDYTGRALWVNYLAGGSRVLPKEPGLNIPIDACMALHSDAGKRSDDSTVGTLGIYYTNSGASYDDGTPRINSRMLTDLLLRQITGDIRQTLEQDWKRRSMWDKSYVEARIPEVPTALIELMSHQNFGDMIYGLDPTFRFIVGRSIYKAMARFMAERKGREVVIQPLPVKDFAIHRTGKNQYRLSWQPTHDKLEPSANPSKYIVFERTEGELGFHRIGETKNTHFNIKVSDNNIHSFKIVAANEGGSSFDSEILALREGSDNPSRPILIVNGFTRVSAPARINSEGRAGFDSEEDFGVPYIRDISFSGYQREFRRSAGESAGVSDNNYSTKVIAGNTFDYPELHGQAISKAGYGFVSASIGAVENGDIKLKDYSIIDFILGKQKEGTVGNGKIGWRFKTFSPKVIQELKSYVHHGGKLFVSGQYVASDLFSMRSDSEDRNFANAVLGIEPASGERIRNPRIDAGSDSPVKNLSRSPLYYNNRLSDKIYIVESPDQLLPTGNARMFMHFNDNGNGAGIINSYGKGKVATMSIPFETLTEASQRENLMKQILNYLEN